MHEIIPSRQFNSLYIYADIVFLVVFCILLAWKKRYVAFFAGLAGGIIYFIVDYGIFYLALGTRTVYGADPCWFLLWLSMSYGITNFALIWLWLDRDEFLLYWALLIPMSWLGIALFAQSFGCGFTQIAISRGTGAYHGVMGLMLVAGYLWLFVHNMRTEKVERYPILWILAIGILVQFEWEFVLFITGIRPGDLRTLVVNSLLETNMGLPYIFLIHRAVMKRRKEDLSKPY